MKSPKNIKTIISNTNMTIQSHKKLSNNSNIKINSHNKNNNH